MTTKTDITTRTYYLTKYALSDGIKVAEGAQLERDPAYIGVGRGWDYATYALGTEAFETEAEAIANADARRVKKIASLKRQIAKLEKMTFGKVL